MGNKLRKRDTGQAKTPKVKGASGRAKGKDVGKKTMAITRGEKPSFQKPPVARPDKEKSTSEGEGVNLNGVALKRKTESWRRPKKENVKQEVLIHCMRQRGRSSRKNERRKRDAGPAQPGSPTTIHH